MNKGGVINVMVKPPHREGEEWMVWPTPAWHWERYGYRIVWDGFETTTGQRVHAVAEPVKETVIANAVVVGVDSFERDWLPKMKRGDVCHVRTHTGEIVRAVYEGAAMCRGEHYVWLRGCWCIACCTPSPQSRWSYPRVRFVAMPK